MARVVCILFDQEVKIHEFAQACLRLSPQIAVREPNILWIEIGKCKNLYSEDGFKARLQVLLKRFHYQAKIGIAQDLSNSLSFARFGFLDSSEFPLEALYDFVDPLGKDSEGKKSVEKMIESLHRLGIKSLSQFRRLPPSQFPSRFGSLGLFCRQQVETPISLPWPQWSPPETYLEVLDLNHSEYCSYIEPLLFKSKEILDRVFSRLRGKFLRADQIQFIIELEKYSIVKNPIRTWTFELISPQGSTQGFLPILRERLNWDLQKDPIESFVTKIQVKILSFSFGKNSQHNFFHSREDFDEEMGSFFGQIEEYLGKGQVFWASITEERYPEKSWIKKRNPEDQIIDPTGHYPKRPTRIFKMPISIQVLQDRIIVKGRIFKSRKWSSVERISLDWIDQCPARNYYCVELEDYRTFWIFTDPGHHYFLHGYYE